MARSFGGTLFCGLPVNLVFAIVTAVFEKPCPAESGWKKTAWVPSLLILPGDYEP